MSILQSSKKLKTGKKNLFDAETDGDAKDKREESGMDTKRIEGRGWKYRDAMIVKGMSGWCPLFHECSWRQEAYTDRGKEKRRKRDTKERTQAKHKGCMQLKTSCESLGKSHRNNPLSFHPTDKKSVFNPREKRKGPFFVETETKTIVFEKL